MKKIKLSRGQEAEISCYLAEEDSVSKYTLFEDEDEAGQNSLVEGKLDCSVEAVSHVCNHLGWWLERMETKHYSGNLDRVLRVKCITIDL